MSHKPNVPAHLRDPGITDAQCWGVLALSAFVGAGVACLWSAIPALVSTLVVMGACVVSLWFHRRRRLVQAYHAQRRRSHAR